MKHRRLKMICVTFIAIFNLFVCFTGAWAWFVSARHSETSGFQVAIYTHELDMSYRVYKYSDDEKTIINATGRNDALTLQKYDSVILSRNEDSAILIEFLITGIALQDNLPIYINSHCTNRTKTDKVISNIVQLQFATIPSISSSTPADIYYDAVEYFEDKEKIYFNQDIKQTDIQFELQDYSSAVENEGLRLYILLDYSPALISNFNFNISDAATTTFTNDLTRIDCYVEED